MAGGLALLLCAVLPLCNVTRSDTVPAPAVVVAAPVVVVAAPAVPSPPVDALKE